MMVAGKIKHLVMHAAHKALAARPGCRLLVVDALLAQDEATHLAELQQLARRTGAWIVAVASPVPRSLGTSRDITGGRYVDTVIALKSVSKVDPEGFEPDVVDLAISHHTTTPLVTITVPFEGRYARFSDHAAMRKL